MVGHRYVHRVRYRECDPMGVVYHAHYVDHFEYARTEALRRLGIPYRELEERGVIMPVVDMSLRFHASAFYDDLLAIDVRFPEPPAARIRIEYTTLRLEPEPANEVIATGIVTLCFVDRERQRPIRAPGVLREAFSHHFES